MLYVYTKEYETLFDPEFMFNQKIRSLVHLTESMQQCLYTYDRAISNKYGGITTPYGDGTLRELSVACKLALCLQLYPYRLFRVYGCSESQLVKVLNESNGKLLLNSRTIFTELSTVNFFLDNTTHVTKTTEWNQLVH